MRLKFKVGDRVRVKKDITDGPLTLAYKGELGTVKVAQWGRVWVPYDVKLDSGQLLSFEGKELDHATGNKWMQG